MNRYWCRYKLQEMENLALVLAALAFYCLMVAAWRCVSPSHVSWSLIITETAFCTASVSGVSPCYIQYQSRSKPSETRTLHFRLTSSFSAFCKKVRISPQAVSEASRVVLVQRRLVGAHIMKWSGHWSWTKLTEVYRPSSGQHKAPFPLRASASIDGW